MEKTIAITHGIEGQFSQEVISSFCARRGKECVATASFSEEMRFDVKGAQWAPMNADSFFHIYAGAEEELNEIAKSLDVSPALPIKVKFTGADYRIYRVSVGYIVQHIHSGSTMLIRKNPKRHCSRGGCVTKPALSDNRWWNGRVFRSHIGKVYAVAKSSESEKEIDSSMFLGTYLRRPTFLHVSGQDFRGDEETDPQTLNLKCFEDFRRFVIKI